MSDDQSAIIEVCVEIIRETTQALGVMHSPSGFTLVGERTLLVWLPRAEIRTIDRQAGGAAVIEIPRWLAEKEGLTDTPEPHDPNQGVLL
jgi:hypothetical protein